MTFTSLIAIFVGVFGLFSIGAAFRAHTLTLRIALLRRTLLVFGALLVPMAATLVVTAQVRPPSAREVTGAEVPIEWYRELRLATDEHLLGFSIVAFVLTVVAIQGALLLGSLRVFVTEQALDLTTREQIADHGGRVAS